MIDDAGLFNQYRFRKNGRFTTTSPDRGSGTPQAYPHSSVYHAVFHQIQIFSIEITNKRILLKQFID
ncbi:MAG: hypothetical protein LZF61_08655 [Nitrosomonas sp.]|nr:MAG: hypothetical protein LZF61_08655 [Nitrosomonas sp.]